LAQEKQSPWVVALRYLIDPKFSALTQRIPAGDRHRQTDRQTDRQTITEL